MRKLISIMVLALLAIGAMAQTTDRLSASSTLKYTQGVERDKDMIEIFRYEAQLEGKRLANHEKLIIIQVPTDPPFALTYDEKDTSLVVLRSNETQIVWDKTKIKVEKMKVGVALYDSIQMLHMLANYTAVPMDQRPDGRLVHFVTSNKDPNALFSGLLPGELDFVHLHFVWGDPTGDKYAKTHNCESETAKILKRTFLHICWAVYNNRPDLLETLEDTIHLLQIQYRRLLLPDVNIDGISLDKSRRQ